jgi:hypothetical protein
LSSSGDLLRKKARLMGLILAGYQHRWVLFYIFIFTFVDIISKAVHNGEKRVPYPKQGLATVETQNLRELVSMAILPSNTTTSPKFG